MSKAFSLVAIVSLGVSVSSQFISHHPIPWWIVALWLITLTGLAAREVIR